MLQTIRLLHRIAVDWIADTFGLRGHGSARSRHDRAGTGRLAGYGQVRR